VTRLILWRHGQTEFNAASRIQGQFDAPLSDLGRRQAAAAALRLAALKPDLIVASDLQRAAHTAAALAEVTGLEVALDERLRERHFGEWQGLLLTEVAERWPDAYTRWRAGEPAPDVGIEEVDDLAKRVSTAVLEVVARATEQFGDSATVVAATHGGAAKYGSGALLGWDSATTGQLAGLDNCHWTELVPARRGGWLLRAHNVS
jgi:glucosyl-3-phosphoglycerate phosphatase